MVAAIKPKPLAQIT